MTKHEEASKIILIANTK